MAPLAGDATATEGAFVSRATADAAACTAAAALTRPRPYSASAPAGPRSTAVERRSCSTLPAESAGLVAMTRQWRRR